MTEETASGKYILVASEGQKYDPYVSHKRRYRKVIEEAINVLQCELKTFERNSEASEGLPGYLLELIKANQQLVGMQEIKED